MDKKDLRKLANDTKKGSKEAFNKLFLACYTPLVEFAFYFLNHKESAEDTVTDIFYKLWSKHEQLSEINNLESYLYVSVKNACFDQLKKQQGDNPVVNPLTDSTFPRHYPGEDKELKTLLENAINALPEQRQIIFRLIKEQGMKCSEVAAILEISVRTVESQLYKAVKTLANTISFYLGYNPQEPIKKRKGLNLFFFL